MVAGLEQAEPLPQPVELKPELPQFRPSTTVAEAFAGSQNQLKLYSAVALVIDQEDGQLLYAKNTDAIMPIASITKLMTAVVALDAKLPLDELDHDQPGGRGHAEGHALPAQARRDPAAARHAAAWR